MTRWTAEPRASARARPGGAPARRCGPRRRRARGRSGWWFAPVAQRGPVARSVGDPGFAGPDHGRGIRCFVAPTRVGGSLGGSTSTPRDRTPRRSRAAGRAPATGPATRPRQSRLLRRQLAELSHDEAVAGPRRGDVEKPPHLALALTLLALLEIVYRFGSRSRAVAPGSSALSLIARRRLSRSTIGSPPPPPLASARRRAPRRGTRGPWPCG